jgi:hypothetical protein
MPILHRAYHFMFVKLLDAWTKNVFFYRMPLSIKGHTWSEKPDEIPLSPELEVEGKQAFINTWKIGFSPFFRANISA